MAEAHSHNPPNRQTYSAPSNDSSNTEYRVAANLQVVLYNIADQIPATST